MTSTTLLPSASFSYGQSFKDQTPERSQSSSHKQMNTHAHCEFCNIHSLCSHIVMVCLHNHEIEKLALWKSSVPTCWRRTTFCPMQGTVRWGKHCVGAGCCLGMLLSGDGLAPSPKIQPFCLHGWAPSQPVLGMDNSAALTLRKGASRARYEGVVDLPHQSRPTGRTCQS